MQLFWKHIEISPINRFKVNHKSKLIDDFLEIIINVFPVSVLFMNLKVY